MSRLATSQVIGRPRGATLILPCIMRGATILASFLMQGLFNVQESKGDLTRGHYLNSPPIEPSFIIYFIFLFIYFYGIFAHPKNSEMVGWGLEPASLGSARSPLSHPTTLTRKCLRENAYSCF